MAATAPKPLTHASAASFPSPLVMASAYRGSRLLSGVIRTIRIPMLASVMLTKKTQLTFSVGSRSASTVLADEGTDTVKSYCADGFACVNHGICLDYPL